MSNKETPLEHDMEDMVTSLVDSHGIDYDHAVKMIRDALDNLYGKPAAQTSILGERNFTWPPA